MRVALWTPRRRLGWPRALASLLRESVDLEVVSGEPASIPDVDLDVYHVDDRADHAFVYHALLRRPGVVVLEEWGLHQLVHASTAGRGDTTAYRSEARRAHGPLGSFCAGQVLAGRGGRLPALLTLNRRVLEAARGLVATSRAVESLAAPHLRGRPLVHVPLGFVGLEAPPRGGVPRGHGAAPGTPVVLFVQSQRPGSLDRLAAAARSSVERAVPGATLAEAREDDPGLASALAAADVVVALEDPRRHGLGRTVPRALALGRATLVSAGSGASREVPEGIVAHVTPGSTEPAEAAALVRRLLEDDRLRSALGERARDFAAERADPAPPARALHDLLVAVRSAAAGQGGSVATALATGDSLASRAFQEIAVAGRELGLPEPPSGLAPLVTALFPEEVT
jgi:glycosyltransferase involved in cell wall biosynthesis